MVQDIFRLCAGAVQPIQPAIPWVALHQLVVRTAHDDFPLLQEQDLIHLLDADEMVGHPNQRPVLKAGENCREQLALRSGIQPDRRFVKDNDRALLEQNAGKGYSLALSSGKTLPRFLHPGMKPVRKGIDQRHKPGHRSGLPDILFRGIRSPEPDIVCQRGVEQMRALIQDGNHGRDIVAKTRSIHAADRDRAR